MNATDNGNEAIPDRTSSSRNSAISLRKLGSIVAERRVSLQMSQEELASQSGIHRSYISEIERGQRNFTIKVLARIAECLNLSMAQLMQEAISSEGADEESETESMKGMNQ